MKRLFTILTSMAMLAGFTACEQEPEGGNEQTAPVVVLNADKETIKADGTDIVTFEVTVDGVVRTAECQIINLADNSVLTGAKFVTMTPGTYEFKAAFGTTTSETKRIVATATGDEPQPESEVALSVDKGEIEADGNDVATFTVTVDGNAVTEGYTIKNLNYNTDLEGNTFTTTTIGQYTFQTTYDGKKSNTVAISAYNPAVSSDYEIGDIVECAGSKGVVYAFKEFPAVWNEDYTEVLEYNTYCYVFSLDEEDLQWSTEYVYCNCGTQRGEWNTQDMLKNGTSPDKYPAAQWCIAHGEGWFMPSYMELNLMWDAITEGKRDFTAPSVAKFNKIITDNGGEPFISTYYWSSNETSDDLIELVAFMDDSVVCLEPFKDKVYTVRAAYRFLVE